MIVTDGGAMSRLPENLIAKLFIASMMILIASTGFAFSGDSQQTRLNWENVVSNSNGLSADLHVNEFQLLSDDVGEHITFTGAITSDNPLPQIVEWVSVPNGKDLVVTLNTSNYETIEDYNVLENRDMSESVTIGEPALFRGIRMFPVYISPVRVDSDGNVSIAHNISIQAEFSGVNNNLNGSDEEIRLSEDVYRMVKSQIMNLDEVNINVVAPVGRLLVICPDNQSIRNYLEPYILWKRQQGYQITVEMMSMNSSNTQIQTVIRNNFFSDDPIPLDYVLIVGDQDGTYHMAAYYDNSSYSSYTDHWYSRLDSPTQLGDMLGDVAIGRFSIRSTTELQTIVAKVLKYERDVYMTNTHWLDRVCLTAGASSGISVIQTNYAVRELFNDRGIACNDTMWYTMPGGDSQIPNYIVNTMNEGVHFVNYRGYYNMSGWRSNQQNLQNSMTNRNFQPVVITLTCGTGSWGAQTESISEGFLRTGSPNVPKGAVACIGTATTGTHTRFNNVVDVGIFEALLQNNVRSLGWALVHGKYRMWEAFAPGGNSSYIQNFSYWNNLMGDPTLRMWVGVPQIPTVTHQANLTNGQNYIDVHVDLPGEFPELVWATLATEDDVVDTRRFDQSGNVRLFVDDPQSMGTITLTVVGDNVLPYQAELGSDSESVYVISLNATVDDGNNNIPNPGETFSLELLLENSGTSASGSLQGVVTSSDEYVTIIDGTFTIPTISAGSTTTVTDAVDITLEGNTPDGYRPVITLTVDGDQESAIELEVKSWSITITDTEPVLDLGGDDILSEGETCNLYFVVENVGSVTGISGMSGTARSLTDGYTISTDPVSYSFTDGIGSQGAGSFFITAPAEVIPGAPIDMILTLTDGSAIDSVQFRAYAEDPRSQNVTGPDDFGYWAVDNTDTSAPLAPTYMWADIISPENRLNINDTSDEDDASILVDLPFQFGYYDEVFSQITVCTNGWLSMGDYSNHILFRNWPIPNPMGPPMMIAPNWDDMRVSNNQGIYTYHDAGIGRFIITWECETARNGHDQLFQVILFDPSFYSTDTGNGRILFQYEEIQFTTSASSDNDYSTIGIENQEINSGIQYYYWQNYAENASTIGSGTAILFTDYLETIVGDPTAVISDTPIDMNVIAGMNSIGEVTIGNTGTTPLFWNMTAIDGIVTQADILSNLGFEPVYDSNIAYPFDASLHRQKGDDVAETYTASSIGLDDSGGPDAFGYEWFDSDDPDGPTYNWISNIGDALDYSSVLGAPANDAYFPTIDLPFVFPFYGVDRTSVSINVNGFLTFADATDLPYTLSWDNVAMPSVEAPHLENTGSVIAPWWDDLTLDNAGSIYVYMGATDTLLVTFSGVESFSQGGVYNFQLLLTADGKILFQYSDMGENRIDSADIGMQNSDASLGFSIVHNLPFIQNDYAISIVRPLRWLEIVDESGIVGPDASTNAQFRIRGESVPIGDYSGTIHITNNDEDNPVVDIPINVSIIAGGMPPVVTAWNDQSIMIGSQFSNVNLDGQVSDPVWADNRMTWTYQGNDELEITINENRILMIDPPTDTWSGSETVRFYATNPEDLSDSCDVTFEIRLSETPPEIDDIPNQVVDYGDPFDEVELDDYVEDPFYDDNLIVWSFENEVDLVVTIDANRFLYVETPDDSWSGEETILLIATNPESLSDSAFVTYEVLASGVSGTDIPTEFSISDLYPNPFNPSTSVRVALPQASDIKLNVYDILGRSLTSELIRNAQPGYHTLSWSDPGFSSGVYFFIVEAGHLRQIKKAVLIK
jgi:Peptidase family C25